MSLGAESSEIKAELTEKIASLKKQTILWLVLVLVCVIASLFLFSALKRTNHSLADSTQALKIMRDSLEKSSDSLATLSELWRKHVIELNQKNDSLQKFGDKSPIETTQESHLPNTSTPKPHKTTVPLPAVSKEKNYLGFLVYIQDRKESKMSTVFRTALQGKGFTVPRIEHIGSAKTFTNAVKYFHKEDEQVAFAIQAQLLEILKQNNLPSTKKDMGVSYINIKTVPIGQFEIWIDK